MFGGGQFCSGLRRAIANLSEGSHGLTGFPCYLRIIGASLLLCLSLSNIPVVKLKIPRGCPKCQNPESFQLTGSTCKSPHIPKSGSVGQLKWPKRGQPLEPDPEISGARRCRRVGSHASQGRLAPWQGPFGGSQWCPKPPQQGFPIRSTAAVIRASLLPSKGILVIRRMRV